MSTNHCEQFHRRARRVPTSPRLVKRAFLADQVMVATVSDGRSASEWAVTALPDAVWLHPVSALSPQNAAASGILLTTAGCSCGATACSHLDLWVQARHHLRDLRRSRWCAVAESLDAAMSVRSGLGTAMAIDGDVWIWGGWSFGERFAMLPAPARVLMGKHVVAVKQNRRGLIVLDREGRVFLGKLPVLARHQFPTDLHVRCELTSIAGLPRITRLVAGFDHVLLLDAEGDVWAFGNNRGGQGGIGTLDESWIAVPRRIARLEGIRDVATWGHACYALREDGVVFAWGDADDVRAAVSPRKLAGGQLLVTPEPVLDLPPLRRVAAGSGFAVALDADGRLFEWGNNQNALVNDPDRTSSLPVSEIPEVAGIRTVVAGHSHVLALTVERRVLAWGTNRSGALGHDPRSIGWSGPVAVPGVTDAIDVVAGTNCSFALLADGRLIAWGNNEFFAIGNGRASGWEGPTPVPGFRFCRV